MTAIRLYNFAHRLNAPGSFVFGNYEIAVSAEDIEAARTLSTHGSSWRGSAPNGGPAVRHTASAAGVVARTASARRRAPAAGSVLFPHVPKADDLSDLCAALWFLTGRRVYLHEDLTGFESVRHGQSVVGGNYFHHPNPRWPDLQAIADHELMPAFWAFMQANDNADLLGKVGYASSCLDALSTRWSKQFLPKRSAADKKNVQSVVKKLKELMREELHSEVICEDATKRIENIFSASAITKLTAFVVSLDLLPEQPLEEELLRFKLLNRVRNQVVHAADLPSELGEDFSRNAEIGAYIAQITVEICAAYLTQLAGVEDYNTIQSRQNIAKFFKSGVFNDHRVFEESFEAFVARQKDAWLSGYQLE